MNNFFLKISYKFTILSRLYSLLSYSQKKKFFYLFFLLIIGVFFEALSIGLIMPVLIILTNNNSENFAFIHQFFNYFTPFQNIYILLSIVLLVYLIKNIYISFLVWKKTDFCFNINKNISKRLFRLYLFLPLSFHLNINSSILLRNITGEISNVVEAFLSVLQILTETTVLIGIVTLLIIVEPTGSLTVLIIMFLLVFTFHKLTKKRILKWGGERQVHSGQAIKNLQQGIGAIKEIKLMRNEDFFLQRFHLNNIRAATVNKLMIFMTSMPRLWLEVAAVAGVVILITTLLFMEKEFIEIVPLMGLFAGAAFRILPSVTTTVHYVQGLTFSIPTINVIYEEFKLEEKYNLYDNITTTNEKINFNKKIVFNQITFIYEKNIEPTLKNVSFDINKGMKIGIIGKSGVGKSTLINIFLGLLKPSSGEVLVDGISVFDNLNEWYKIIGYVPQDIYLTDDTLARNIAFGVSDDKIDNNRLKEVLKMSNIDKFIFSLPKGLDTVVGERGTRLSGGQLQRIGIARALYRNPKILVLDEATSSLDVENEKDIIDTLDNLKEEITVIIISHRFSTTKNCDKLFLVKNKNIELINNRE